MAAHIETGAMAHPQHRSSKRLDRLGLVAGMCDELGLAGLTDRQIPQDGEKRTVSIGQAVKAMILNGLGFACRALCLTPLFFRDKPAERLIGEGVEAGHLNDGVQGRAPDAIYAYRPDVLYPLPAAAAVRHPGLSCRFGRMDSAGLHTDGRYSSNEAPEEGVIHITKGYSRDRRPDLNRAVLLPICERPAGLPLLMQTLNGCCSDRESFRDMAEDFAEQMRAGFGIECLAADSALYSTETLNSMSALLRISRVPETSGLACDAIDAAAPGLMRDLAKPAFRRFETECGGVRQRRAAAFSPEARLRARKTADKQRRRQSAAELKTRAKLCKQDFACEADVRKASAAFEKALKMTFASDAKVCAIPRFKGKGRPAQGRKPDSCVCRIEGGMASMPQERTRRQERKSRFILAANPLNCEALPDEELIAAYKDQQKAGRGFRFLKDPMFMASTLFLKSPKRIMALMMAMTLSLMVYAALEYRIRESLKAHNEVFPNQKGLLISNPAARWVFQFFSGIHAVVIGLTQELVLNLNEHQAALLKLLGEGYEALYAGSG